jgi:hypothetical protein
MGPVGGGVDAVKTSTFKGTHDSAHNLRTTVWHQVQPIAFDPCNQEFIDRALPGKVYFTDWWQR